MNDNNDNNEKISVEFFKHYLGELATKGTWQIADNLRKHGVTDTKARDITVEIMHRYCNQVTSNNSETKQRGKKKGAKPKYNPLTKTQWARIVDEAWEAVRVKDTIPINQETPPET